MKKILFLVVAAIMSISFSSYCYGLGDAKTYKMTVQKVEAKRTDGTWVTIFELNIEIDVGQDAIGTGGIAAALSGNLPPGTYVNFRITVSETVKFSGQDGAGHFTAANGQITITGTDADAASTATWPAAGLPNITYNEPQDTHSAAGPAREVTVNLDLGAAKAGGDNDNYLQVYAKQAAEFDPPVTIKKSSAVSMFFDFDTANTVQYIQTGGGNDIMLFTPPKEGSQFGITVDGVSYAITEPNMRVDF